jgi:acyl-CoA thioester hydrolase
MQEIKPYSHKINYYETDKMSVTHHSNYIRYMEEARVDFLDQIGWGYDKIEAAGIISPTLSVTCNYKKSTTFPQTIVLYTGVEKLTAVKLFLCYEMKVDGELVSTGTSSHCFLGTDGKPLLIEKQFPELYKILKQLEFENTIHVRK